MSKQNSDTIEKNSPPFHHTAKKELTDSEIRAFREDPLVQSLYKFIDLYDLRLKTLRVFERHLKSKEEVATYKDLE